MPELARLTFASTEIMPGLFGPMRLAVNRDAVDLTRTSSVGGLPFLADHDLSRPLGRIVKTEIRDSLGYAEAHVPTVARNEAYIEELRAHLRDGISPGLYLRAVEFVEEDGELIEHVTRWMCYEISSVTAPRMQNIGLLSLEKTRDKASITGPNRVPPAAPVDLSRSGKRAVVSHSVPDTVRGTRATSLPDVTSVGRARVPTPTGEEKRRILTTQEARVDAKLVDLTRREQAMADAEAAAKTGTATAVQPLDEMILSLAALASNPSAPTPKMHGVEVQAANRNHISARVATAALTAATSYGTEIESPSERGDIQPQGRRASRLLAAFRQATVPYGSKSFPTMSSEPVSGMLLDGAAPLTLTDGAFQTPAPRANFHMAQTRASYTMQAALQGGQVFEDMVNDSLTEAMASLKATQIIGGSGVAPNVQGVLNVTGILSSMYASTARGSASTWLAAEGLLEVQEVGPEIRRVWIISSELYRTAKQTVTDPGTGQFVLSGGRILDEVPAIKNNDLGDDQALLIDAGYWVFAKWDQADLVLDGISSPGNLRVTLSEWFDLVPIRANSALLLDEM